MSDIYERTQRVLTNQMTKESLWNSVRMCQNWAMMEFFSPFFSAVLLTQLSVIPPYERTFRTPKTDC